MEIFAERLKELRAEKGISQMQLASQIGTTKSAVSLWEAQKRVPSALVIIALAKYFGVTSDYLLGLED